MKETMLMLLKITSFSRSETMSKTKNRKQGDQKCNKEKMYYIEILILINFRTLLVGLHQCRYF